MVKREGVKKKIMSENVATKNSEMPRMSQMPDIRYAAKSPDFASIQIQNESACSQNNQVFMPIDLNENIDVALIDENEISIPYIFGEERKISNQKTFQTRDDKYKLDLIIEKLTKMDVRIEDLNKRAQKIEKNQNAMLRLLASYRDTLSSVAAKAMCSKEPFPSSNETYTDVNLDLQINSLEELEEFEGKLQVEEYRNSLVRNIFYILKFLLKKSYFLSLD
jgi:hypothetical protein